MEYYNALRDFIGNWNLLFMLAFFVGTVAWVMRPNAKQVHDDAASIPFKED